MVLVGTFICKSVANVLAPICVPMGMLVLNEVWSDLLLASYYLKALESECVIDQQKPDQRCSIFLLFKGCIIQIVHNVVFLHKQGHTAVLLSYSSMLKPFFGLWKCNNVT